jgi:hypothetical protein
VAFLALLDARVEGGLERVAHAPDRHVVEIEAVRPAGFQGFDAQLLCAIWVRSCSSLLMSVSFHGVDDERMNALFQMEAKLNPQE